MSHECKFCSGSSCSTCRNTGREGLTYQIGALLDFRSSDIEVDGLPTAHLRAKAQMDTNWETPVGVWTGQAHGSELVEIWYQGRQFSG